MSTVLESTELIRALVHQILIIKQASSFLEMYP